MIKRMNSIKVFSNKVYSQLEVMVVVCLSSLLRHVYVSLCSASCMLGRAAPRCLVPGPWVGTCRHTAACGHLFCVSFCGPLGDTPQSFVACLRDIALWGNHSPGHMIRWLPGLKKVERLLNSPFCSAEVESLIVALAVAAFEHVGHWWFK